MLLPRAGGTGSGSTDPIVVNANALWDFAYTLTGVDVALKYFDFPATEPDMLTGGESHVIGIVNGIAQHLTDYTVVQDGAGKWRRMIWAGMGLETAPAVKDGDKVWVIYPVLIQTSGGGGGTSNHEALNNLYPSSIGSGRHNHLTDEQLAKLLEIIASWTGGGLTTNHEALSNLLPTSIGTGPHYHLSQALLDFLESLIGAPGNDNPDLPGYVPRGHEQLTQLLPAGLAAGDHYHLDKTTHDSLLHMGPETPDVRLPLDRSSIMYTEGVVAG